MPIEPTSVSKPLVREVEKASGGASSNLWSAAHGGSTGGKDSPLSSIWDKAISGAQKLFGMEKSSARPSLENEEEERSPNQERQTGQSSGDLSAGLGNRRMGGFGFAGSSGNAFASVSTSRQTVEPVGHEGFDAKGSAYWRDESPTMGSEKEARPTSGAEATQQSATAEGESASELDEEDKDAAEKRRAAAAVSSSARTSLGVVSAALDSNPGGGKANAQATPVAAAPQPTAMAAGSALGAASTAAPGHEPIEVTKPSSAVGQPAGMHAPRERAQATAASVAVLSGPAIGASPVTSSRQASQGQSGQKTDAVAMTAESLNPAPAGPLTPQAASKVAGSAIPSEEGPLAGQAKPTDAKQGTAAPAENGSKSELLAGDSLQLDATKGKESVSDAFKRPVEVPKPVATPVAKGQVSANNGLSQATETRAEAVVGKSELQDASASRAAESLSEPKELTAPESSKREFGLSHQRPNLTKTVAPEAGPAQRSGSESTADEAKAIAAAQKTQSQNAAGPSAGAREGVATAVRATAPVANQNRGPNAQGAAPLSGVAAAGAGVSTLTGAQQNHSQQGDANNAAKQDLGMAASSALAAKGAERSSSESAPAFELKTLAGEASRKSQVTSKTQTSSYVSKTAEEVKEVVAAMTKSIDRLVTNKSGAMNLKINFDQGGSMTLRISMDGGQVSTNMQTDVAGLESAIKANWGELANDWNQKGVKLNMPQFQQLAGQQADADSEANAWNEFNQRQERQGSFQSALGRNGNGNGSGARSGSQGSGAASATGPGSASGDGIAGVAQEANVISDTELKTYA